MPSVRRAVPSDIVATDDYAERLRLPWWLWLCGLAVAPWVAGAVQVGVDDPADPTPYWVVSSRDPVRLAEALVSAAPPR